MNSDFPVNSWDGIKLAGLETLEKKGKAGIGEDREANGQSSDSDGDLYDTASAIPSSAVKKKVTSNLTSTNINGVGEVVDLPKEELPSVVRLLIKPLSTACGNFMDCAMKETDFHVGAPFPIEDQHQPSVTGPTQALNYFSASFNSFKLKDSCGDQNTYPTMRDYSEDDEREVVKFFSPVIDVMFNCLLGCSALSSDGQIPLPPVEEAATVAPQEQPDDIPKELEKSSAENSVGLEEVLLPETNALFRVVQDRWSHIRKALLASSSETKSFYLSLRLKLGAWHQERLQRWPKNLWIAATGRGYGYQKTSYENPYNFIDKFASYHLGSWLLAVFAPLQLCLEAEAGSASRASRLEQLANLPTGEKVQAIRQELLKFLPSSKREKELAKESAVGGEPALRFKPSYEEAPEGVYYSVPTDWLLNWRKNHCPEDEWPVERPTAATRAKKEKYAAVLVTNDVADIDAEIDGVPNTQRAPTEEGEGVLDFVQRIAEMEPMSFDDIYDLDKETGPEIKYNGEGKLSFVPKDIIETFHLAYGGGPLISHPFYFDAKLGYAVPSLAKVKFTVSYEVDPKVSNVFDFDENARPMTARYVLMKLVYPQFMNDSDRTEVDDLLGKDLIQLEKKPKGYSYMAEEEDPLPWDEVIEFSTYSNEFRVVKSLAPGETKYVRGHAGLSNLGNTCYMNAAIQCISCTTPLRHKMIGNQGGADPEHPADPSVVALLRESPSAPDAGDGTPMSYQFTKLLKNMWSGKKRSNDPKDFRNAIIARFARFANYEQHDSIELVNGVLDAMHEELNLVKVKKYRERKDEDDGVPEPVLQKLFWDDYKMNNQSIFAPIFHGQLKSRLECVECRKVRVVFDAFSCLPLSIDRLEKQSFDLPIFDVEKGRVYTVRVRVPLQSPVAVLKADLLKMEMMADLTGDDLEIIKHSPKRYSGSSILWAVNKDEINAQDEFYVFILRNKRQYTQPLPVESTALSQVKVTSVDEEADAVPDTSKQAAEKKEDKIPEPTFLPFCRCFVFVMGTATSQYGVTVEKDLYRFVLYFDPTTDTLGLHRLLWEQLRPTIDIKKSSEELHTNVAKNVEDSRSEAVKVDAGDVAELDEIMLFDDFCRAVTVDIRMHYRHSSSWEPLSLNDEEKAGKPVSDTPHSLEKRDFCEFKVTLAGTQMSFRNITDDPVKDKSLKAVPENKDVKSEATLGKCFERASNSHCVDDQVYCPNCKTHQDTIKEERVWVLPDVLILQYKRFQFSMATLGMKKIDTDVDFPTELDMAPYVTKECRETENTKYTLRGVIWHSGSVSFGHYTATAWDSETKQWVYYDDSSASEKEDAPSGGGRAYIMFYQRTTDDDTTAPRQKQTKIYEEEMAIPTAGGSDDMPPPLEVFDQLD